jgi:uncharacterized UPF0160 family protein
MKIVTHSGKFHADDVFAVATLLLIFPDAEVIRSRDEEVIKSADIVVDVGSLYDVETGRFDHHQKEGAGVRDNGIPYSSFGIVWKEYGEKLCGSKTVAEALDHLLVEPLDALDNGVVIEESIVGDVHEYTIGDLVSAFNPSWKEELANYDESFYEAVAIAQKVLAREIAKSKDKEKGEKLATEAYQKSGDKRIIILEQYVPWYDVLSKYSEPLFVVYPNADNTSWHVQAVREDPYSYQSRKDFPKTWGGKRDSELAEITGVADAIFCHRNLFLCVAQSKEGAITLAQKALEN